MNHLTLAVSNLDRSFDFYKNALELQPLVRWDCGAYFLTQKTAFWFCLNLDDTCKPAGDCTHYAFSVDALDFDRLSENIRAYGASLWKKNTSPGDSLYFLDPDGHKLEIHTDCWNTRIAAKKRNFGNWQQVTWFV